MSVSMDPDLGDDVRRAAAASGKGLSAWMAEAAAAKLRAEALGAFLEEWEKDHGAFTEHELGVAEAELGLRPQVDR